MLEVMVVLSLVVVLLTLTLSTKTVVVDGFGASTGEVAWGLTGWETSTKTMSVESLLLTTTLTVFGPSEVLVTT